MNIFEIDQYFRENNFRFHIRYFQNANVISTTEFAEVLGVSNRTLRKWLGKHGVKSLVKIASRNMYYVEDIAEVCDLLFEDVI